MQFRSLSDQLYGTEDQHAAVRASIVAQLRADASRYSCYVVGDSFEQYLKDMTQQGTWGDHVTLQAAADALGMRITVITSYQECAILAIEPAQKRSERMLYLSFWAEVSGCALLSSITSSCQTLHDILT